MRNMQRKYGYFMKEKSLLQLHAYDSIKNSILSGELEPRVLYSETKLSAQIGISRTPMREALQSLSQDGYITIIPSKGFMIRQLNEKDMKDSIEIRCAIEGFCTNMIATQIYTERGRQLLKDLEAVLKNMEGVFDKEDCLEDFIDYDHQFHLLLVNYMQNDEFDHIFQRLLYLIRLTSLDALAVKGRITGTMNEHREYLKALKAGNKAKAYEIMLHHLMMPLKMHEKNKNVLSS